MIKSIKISDNESIIGKWWGKKTIAFTEGVNVVYGPNGCGKSLLLQQLGYYTFVSDKGWSRGITPRTDHYSMCSSFWKLDIKEYIEKKNKLGKCELDWDGVATFKTDGALTDAGRIVAEIMCGCDNKQDLPFDKLKFMERNNLSNGQRSMLYVENILNLEVPDLSLPVDPDSYFKEYGKILSDYVSTLPRDGKPTLLIDEIDNFMDFDNLFWFWNEAIPKLVEKYQIIIVTHSPMFLKPDTMNIIGKKYYEKSIKLLHECIN
jgi:archaellum biogenesis ATPase FlaH